MRHHHGTACLYFSDAGVWQAHAALGRHAAFTDGMHAGCTHWFCTRMLGSSCTRCVHFVCACSHCMYCMQCIHACVHCMHASHAHTTESRLTFDAMHTIIAPCPAHSHPCASRCSSNNVHVAQSNINEDTDFVSVRTMTSSATQVISAMHATFVLQDATV